MEALEQKIIELEKKKQDLKNQINDIENNISNTDEPVQKWKQRKRGLLAEIEKIDNEINELRVNHNPSSFVDQIERMLLDEPISLGDIQDACNLVDKTIKSKIKTNGLHPDYLFILGRVSEILRDPYLAFDYYTTGITLHRLLHIEVNEDLSKRLRLINKFIYPTGIYYRDILTVIDLIDHIFQVDRSILSIPLVVRDKQINRKKFIEKIQRMTKDELELVLFYHKFKSDEIKFDRDLKSIGKDILEHYENRGIEDLLIQELQGMRPEIRWLGVYEYTYK